MQFKKAFLYINRSTLIFIALFVIMSVAYYDSVLDKEPLNTHTWRQTDCLSLTRNYAQGNGLLEPEMDILLADGMTTGKTAGEFPILYYFVGKVWQFFGESVLFYRLFYLAILFFTVWAFYRSLKLIFKDNFLAISVSLLLFTSPVFVVYGVSFLTDVPGLCFVFIGMHFLHLYYLKRKFSSFILFVLLVALGGLIKISSLILFVFVCFIFVLEYIFKIKTLNDRYLFQRKWQEILGFLSVFIFLLMWYFYSSYYNELHGFKYTFNNIYPLWNTEIWNQETLVKGIKNFTSHVFYSRPMIFMLFILFFANLFVSWKKVTLFGYLANIIVFVGALFYFILWGPLLENHDYYFVAFLALLPAIFIPFFYHWYKSDHSLFSNKIVRSFLLVFVLFNFTYCYQMTRLKTLAQNGLFITVGNHHLDEMMHWQNWNTTQYHHVYRRVRPYLKELGIKKDDLVISFPDPTFNESLYLMNRKGWTNFKQMSTSEEIYELIEKGASYLILREDFLNQSFLNPFTRNKIGEFEKLHFFKLN